MPETGANASLCIGEIAPTACKAPTIKKPATPKATDLISASSQASKGGSSLNRVLMWVTKIRAVNTATRDFRCSEDHVQLRASAFPAPQPYPRRVFWLLQSKTPRG